MGVAGNARTHSNNGLEQEREMGLYSSLNRL